MTIKKVRRNILMVKNSFCTFYGIVYKEKIWSIGNAEESERASSLKITFALI